MASGTVSFSAKFNITVTVPIGVWGDDTNFKAMREQLKKEAAQKLRGDLEKVDYVIHGIKLQSIQGVEE